MQSTNEKYTFRTWLLRLGMIGDEFKTARKFLLENLDGCIAWKNPSQALEQRERLRIAKQKAQAEDHSEEPEEQQEQASNNDEQQDEEETMPMGLATIFPSFRKGVSIAPKPRTTTLTKMMTRTTSLTKMKMRTRTIITAKMRTKV